MNTAIESKHCTLENVENLQKFILPSLLSIQEQGLKTKTDSWSLDRPNQELKAMFQQNA